MRTVINVLAAKIPDMQDRGLRTVRGGQPPRGDDHAVGRRHACVIILIAQPATDLRLSDSAVTEHDQFHVRHDDRAGAEIVQVGAQ